MTRLRFARPEWGVLTVTVGGITYRATYYPPANGQRGYWVVRTSDRTYSDGDDWYEPSEARVREAISGVAAKQVQG